MDVFLGGTWNDSKWRDEIIPLLSIDYFNPIVDDWDENAQQLEIEKRNSCDILLYVITPKMSGVYSIAEVVQDSNIRPEKTIFCYLEKDDDLEFDDGQIKSLDMVKQLIKNNGAIVCDDLKECADIINDFKVIEKKIFTSINDYKKYI